MVETIITSHTGSGVRRKFPLGGQGVMSVARFLENIVILCFERHFSKQNSVIRLKFNILVYTDSIHCRILFIHFFIFRV